MPSENDLISSSILIQYTNCRLLRDQKTIKDDLWVRDGKIQDPRVLFWKERIQADIQIDCGGCIVAPGFIDVQINGGFGIDFTSDESSDGVDRVARQLLTHGVTSFCPTVITSTPCTYQKAIPKLKQYKRKESCCGATLLGETRGIKTRGSVKVKTPQLKCWRCENIQYVSSGLVAVMSILDNGGAYDTVIKGIHLEGPFINKEKRGAHPPEFVRSYENGGIKDLISTYESLDAVAIVTLAPELPNSDEVVRELVRRGINVSVGHSMANLKQAEEAVHSGANFITHLFNAMLPFHHRDPGIVGLLASSKIPPNKTIFYGIIADGIHTHPAALRIAHKTHPNGAVLVTDAIAAMGLQPGIHNLGSFRVNVTEDRAFVLGTETLAGSIASMVQCIKTFHSAARCSIEEAVEAATLHPAQMLGIEHQKGTLNYGADADFVFLDDDLNVLATFIKGVRLWNKSSGFRSFIRGARQMDKEMEMDNGGGTSPKEVT